MDAAIDNQIHPFHNSFTSISATPDWHLFDISSGSSNNQSEDNKECDYDLVLFLKANILTNLRSFFIHSWKHQKSRFLLLPRSSNAYSPTTH